MTADVDINHLAEVVFVSFLHSKITHFFFSLNSNTLKGGQYLKTILKESDVLPFLEWV